MTCLGREPKQNQRGGQNQIHKQMLRSQATKLKERGWKRGKFCCTSAAKKKNLLMLMGFLFSKLELKERKTIRLERGIGIGLSGQFGGGGGVDRVRQLHGSHTTGGVHGVAGGEKRVGEYDIQNSIQVN